MSSQPYHIPALLADTIELLNINPSGTYIDATFGGGGHSRAILEHLGPEGHLYSFDRDPDAISNSIDDPRFTFVHSNFRYIRNFMRFYGVDRVDGILADLGVSFHHFDTAERGFSFRADAPLDMRMNRNAAVSAADIVETYDSDALTSIFKTYTDLKKPKKIAEALVKARQSSPIDTTSRLVEAVTPYINARQEKKELAQVFQALRIATNNEMEDLEEFLHASIDVLKADGRLAVLTYHSIEDRIVKSFMRYGNTCNKEEKDFYGRVSTPWIPVTRKPVEASEAEIEANPRSRSAKLRVAQLKGTGDETA